MNSKSGITFLEVLIIIVVLGVVGAITVPKFKVMINQSREGKVKSRLGDLRGALAIYYSDTSGLYPSDRGTPETRLSSVLVPRYVPSIPFVQLPHLHSKKLNTVSDRVDDAGDWIYTTYRGFVAVNCNHADTKGEIVSNW